KAGRLKAGWHPEHADAMARVESQYGDQPGSGAELNKKYSELSEELRGITSQVRLIEDEGRRLTRAIRAFEDHREAMEQLRRHQGPLGVVRRLFSTGARQEYQHTVDHVKITANFMHVNGVNSEADLQQQLATWQHQQAQVTGLEGRAERLRTQMGDISLACRGLELEAARKRQARTRDEDWQHIRDRLEGRMQERSRDRTADRGR
ncbi:MAG TPA: hypothetical protein VK464_29160, partial [Symbiobacteriaceae bacterium]|nr:hypothetical protein [Symbiobacteriaceae bacterium]